MPLERAKILVLNIAKKKKKPSIDRNEFSNDPEPSSAIPCSAIIACSFQSPFALSLQFYCCTFFVGAYKRTNLSAPRQPKKDSPRHHRHLQTLENSNIGTFKHHHVRTLAPIPILYYTNVGHHGPVV